jgi:DNA polymerase elongation subunit (family B)
MYYDIKTIYDKKRNDPLIGSDIIIITCICSCGSKKTFGRMMVSRPGVESHQRHSSTAICMAICMAFIDHVREYKPMFLVAHSAYGFDNRSIAYHLAKEVKYQHYFAPISIKNDPFPGFKLIIDIPGVNNVDSLVYIMKSKSSSFESFSLAGLSNVLNTHKRSYAPAFTMPLDQVEHGSMFRHNINDCYALKGVCDELDILTEISNLCQSARSPFKDVSVYETGLMTWSYILHNCVEQNLFFKWPERIFQFSEIRGGQIMSTGPKAIGYNICIAFDSLYPSIMSTCNISRESIEVSGEWSHSAEGYSRRLLDEFSLDWDKEGCVFEVNGISARFPDRSEVISVMSRCSQQLAARSSECNAGGETSLAACKKTLNHSTYRALASRSYPSYSPKLHNCR